MILFLFGSLSFLGFCPRLKLSYFGGSLCSRTSVAVLALHNPNNLPECPTTSPHSRQSIRNSPDGAHGDIPQRHPFRSLSSPAVKVRQIPVASSSISTVFLNSSPLRLPSCQLHSFHTSPGLLFTSHKLLLQNKFIFLGLSIL